MTLSDSFATLRPHIDEATASSLAHLLMRAGASCRSEEFSEAVLASVAGGKRFRALMAHIGYSLGADIPVEDVALPHLSAALELYQASALVHDDIIDKADERRGMPTPHRSLAIALVDRLIFRFRNTRRDPRWRLFVFRRDRRRRRAGAHTRR